MKARKRVIGNTMYKDKLDRNSRSCSISLPVITDDLFDLFNDTDLICWNKTDNRAEWTQTAVDFAVELGNHCDGI